MYAIRSYYAPEILHRQKSGFNFIIYIYFVLALAVHFVNLLSLDRYSSKIIDGKLLLHKSFVHPQNCIVRITSYNVCYTKLLRLNIPTTTFSSFTIFIYNFPLKKVLPPSLCRILYDHYFL